MEYHKDIIGEQLYASRNHNNLRHTYEAGTHANRTTVDWNLTLRQVRKPRKDAGGAASAPNLHTAEIGESRRTEPLAPEHPDGPYHGESPTLGRYQNFANSSHMLNGLTRVSSSKANGIDWQLNLRGGLHQNEHKAEDRKWKRHYARPQVSFDMMKENCAATNADYQRCEITPQDRRKDRREGAISIETIRDDPISFRRWPGCEGTQVGAWRHLIEDRSRGYKGRRHLQHEVTLREYPGDKNGAKITDNRFDGCIVEMLGKKKWIGHEHHDSLHQRWPQGDAKLYHLSRKRILPEPDEENRNQRMSRQVRTDVNIPETNLGKSSPVVAE